MLESLVAISIKSRKVVAGLLVLVLALGVIAARRLPIDALPDVSSVQVDILTKCGGLSPVEVERTVTVPIEKALNGLPRSAQLRSVSRFGLSSVTVVFQDGTDIWWARQMVLERIRQEPRTSHLPVVMLTSSAEHIDIERCYALGANSYVRKPISFTEFLEAAKQLDDYWHSLNLGVPRS